MINREDAGSVPCNAGIDSVHYILFFFKFLYHKLSDPGFKFV